VANDLYVLRHGETSWSRERRHTGWSEIPLTDAGREQAAAAGEALRALRGGRPWALVVSSPLGRAAETARLAGVDARYDDRLREWNYGSYEGITTEAIQVDRPGWSLWRDGCPDGEAIDEVASRAGGILNDTVRGALDEGDVLLVAHSHLLRILTACWLELDASEGRLFVLDPAGIGVLGTERETPALLGWNFRSPAPERIE
jgi:broad specificity phosphatase PhoE